MYVCDLRVHNVIKLVTFAEDLSLIMFFLAILYMIIAGLIGRWLYFLIVGLFQYVVSAPLLLWSKHKKKRKEIELTSRELIVFRIYGAFTTFIVGLGWAFVVGSLVFTAIDISGSSKGYWWVFYVLGFFILVMIKQDEEKSDSQLIFGAVIYLAALIGYGIILYAIICYK